MNENKQHHNDRIKLLAKKLLTHNFKVAVAESCTGGMFAQHCTAVSGSSTWFECGFVTYSNASKISMLGVNIKVLNKYGAVSKQVADEMANGVLKNSDAHLAVSITGVAGPGGGTPDKPVGTVYIATALLDKPTITRVHHFEGDRYQIRRQTVNTAIDELIERLDE